MTIMARPGNRREVLELSLVKEQSSRSIAAGVLDVVYIPLHPESVIFFSMVRKRKLQKISYQFVRQLLTTKKTSNV